jgi:hypothetical protein
VRNYNFCWAAFLFIVCLGVSSAYAISIESTGSRYEPGGVRYFFTVTTFGGVVTWSVMTGVQSYVI